MLRRETWEQTKNTMGRGVLYAATGYWAQRKWGSSLWVLERHFVQKAVSPWTIMPPSTEDGGKEGKNKNKKTNKIKGSNKEKEKGGNQDGP